MLSSFRRLIVELRPTRGSTDDLHGNHGVDILRFSPFKKRFEICECTAVCSRSQLAPLGEDNSTFKYIVLLYNTPPRLVPAISNCRESGFCSSGGFSRYTACLNRMSFSIATANGLAIFARRQTFGPLPSPAALTASHYNRVHHKRCSNPAKSMASIYAINTHFEKQQRGNHDHLTSGARSWWARTCVLRGTCCRTHPARHAGFRRPGHAGYATRRARFPKTRPRSERARGERSGGGVGVGEQN